MKVYADNAAFKPLLPEVKQFIHDFIETDFRNPSAIYSNGRSTRRLIEQAREHVLKAIGLSDELAKASIRITIDENITDEQIEYVVNTIKDCVAKMRQSSPLWKEITNEDN